MKKVSKRRRRRTNVLTKKKRKRSLKPHNRNKYVGGKYNEDIFCFVISGFGCKESHGLSFVPFFARSLNTLQENVSFICHKSTSATRAIGSTIAGNCPLVNSSFLRELIIQIKDKVANPKYTKIFIFGYSFGGAISNRVAMELSKEPDTELKNLIKQKINIATGGSIFIPDKELVADINIINYVSITDIGLRCNHLNPPSYDELNVTLTNYDNENTICKYKEKIDNNNVIWTCNYSNNRPLCQSIILNKIAEHNAYNNLFQFLLRAHTIDVNSIEKNTLYKMKITKDIILHYKNKPN